MVRKGFFREAAFLLKPKKEAKETKTFDLGKVGIQK